MSLEPPSGRRLPDTALARAPRCAADPSRSSRTSPTPRSGSSDDALAASPQDLYQLLHRRGTSQPGLGAVDPAGQPTGSLSIEEGVATLDQDRRRAAELDGLGLP